MHDLQYEVGKLKVKRCYIYTVRPKKVQVQVQVAPWPLHGTERARVPKEWKEKMKL